MAAKTFRELLVWQKAHRLVLQIYKVSKDFPVDERYGLVAQLRRASASVSTNIVEGFKRRSRKDFAHFINLAESSLEETKYHLLLARDLGYLPTQDFEELTSLSEEVGKMLSSFYRKLTT